MARLIFGPVGIVFGFLAFVIFGSAIEWAINHWWVILITYIVLHTAADLATAKYRR
jgi:hypothetical protein